MPSTITALSERKAALRAAVRARLAQLSPEARLASDQALFARFLSLPALEKAQRVLLYCGMKAEPDTMRLLPLLWAIRPTEGVFICVTGYLQATAFCWAQCSWKKRIVKIHKISMLNSKTILLNINKDV